RRAHCFSGSQAETSVVPGTAHRVTDHQPFGEWAAVVGAFGADCEKLVAAAREQDRVLAHVAGQHPTVGDHSGRHPLSEIGTLVLGWISAHVSFLYACNPWT